MWPLATLVVAAWTFVGAIVPHPRPTTLGPPPDAATVMARYRAALAHVRRPTTMSFEFALSQLGLHDMDQAHRVYRSGGNERDETLVVDGYRLKAPSVRVFAGRRDHYDIAAIAPREAAYRFRPIAALRVPGGYRYFFKLEPRTPQSFAVREIELDGRTYLPAVVRFHSSANGASGSGELAFGEADAYWMVRSATVVATLRDGKKAREKIVWSRYSFPKTLPPDAFRAPSPRRKPTLVPDTALPAAGAPAVEPGSVGPPVAPPAAPPKP